MPATVDGYQLELSVLRTDGWAQYDLVTGTPLGSVGPGGGYDSGWPNGGVHRLLDSGSATDDVEAGFGGAAGEDRGGR